MNTHKILLICYNHLPEYTPSSVFEEYYQYCYRPFLSVLNRFPEISVSLYFSGVLFKMLESKHPEFLLLLNDMISKKQVELLGGPYNYSILPLQTSHERIASIEMLTNFIRKKFSKRPRGFWLPEFIWSNSLILNIVNCGFEYTFIHQKIDEYLKSQNHFCLTEENYKPLKIFKTLDSFSFPNLLPNEIVPHIQSLSKQSCNVSSYNIAIKGESFKELYDSKKMESPDYMMEKIFSWYRKNLLEYELFLPSKYNKIANHAIQRKYFKTYIPETLTKILNNSSDHENKNDFAELFLGHKDLENFYAKINFVRLLLKNEIRGDKERKLTGIEALSFCFASDMFEFDKGFYNRECRKSAWKHLLEAEKCTNGNKHIKTLLLEQDYDLDSQMEVIVRQKNYDAVVDPRIGAITEFDYFPLLSNLCSVITESSESLGILHDFISLNNKKHLEFSNYTIDHERTALKLQSSIEPLILEKSICFTASSIIVNYAFTNTFNKTIDFDFKTILNLAIDFSLDNKVSDIVVKKNPNLSSSCFRNTIPKNHTPENFLSLTFGSSYPCEYKTDSIVLETKNRFSFPQGTKSECLWHVTITPQNSLEIQFVIFFEH